MRVRQERAGDKIDAKGTLPEISEYGSENYLTTTSLIHFRYHDEEGIHYLREVTIVAVPSGRLQERYNPTFDDGIWNAGRNAPTLGEDFRVRVSFNKLKAKAYWRVQTLVYDIENQECVGSWQP